MNLKHGIGLDQAGEGQSASINGIESQFAHQILDHLRHSHRRPRITETMETKCQLKELTVNSLPGLPPRRVQDKRRHCEQWYEGGGCVDCDAEYKYTQC